MVELNIRVFTVKRHSCIELVAIWIAASTAVTSAVSCQRYGLSSALDPPGFLVLAETGAREFGVSDSDTLVERAVRDVPGLVRASADSVSARLGYGAACTRFFEREGLYVALLITTCDSGQLVEDGEGLAAFRYDGVGVGRVFGFPTADHYHIIFPPSRARRSARDP